MSSNSSDSRSRLGMPRCVYATGLTFSGSFCARERRRGRASPSSLAANSSSIAKSLGRMTPNGAGIRHSTRRQHHERRPDSLWAAGGRFPVLLTECGALRLPQGRPNEVDARLDFEMLLW